MGLTHPFPDCTHHTKECVARREDGKCIALEDSHFEKECPFFMDRETKRKKVAECRSRLKNIGHKRS